MSAFALASTGSSALGSGTAPDLSKSSCHSLVGVAGTSYRNHARGASSVDGSATAAAASHGRPLVTSAGDEVVLNAASSNGHVDRLEPTWQSKD